MGETNMHLATTRMRPYESPSGRELGGRPYILIIIWKDHKVHASSAS